MFFSTELNVSMECFLCLCVIFISTYHWPPSPAYFIHQPLYSLIFHYTHNISLFKIPLSTFFQLVFQRILQLTLFSFILPSLILPATSYSQLDYMIKSYCIFISTCIATNSKFISTHCLFNYKMLKETVNCFTVFPKSK